MSAGAQIDYDALAQKYGSIGSSTVTDPPPPTLHDAIGRAEGAKPEDHNPGNISLDAAKELGIPTTGFRQSTGTGATKIAQFQDDDTGRLALTKHLSKYSPDTTFEQLGAKYAPGQPNWVKNVTSILKLKPTDTIAQSGFVGVGADNNATVSVDYDALAKKYGAIGSQEVAPPPGRTGPLIIQDKDSWLGQLQDKLLTFAEGHEKQQLDNAATGKKPDEITDPTMKYFAGESTNSLLSNPSFVSRSAADLLGIMNSVKEHPIQTLLSAIPQTKLAMEGYFGVQGAKMALEPRGKDETGIDFLQRKLLAASMIVGATGAGAKSTVNMAKQMPDIIQAAKESVPRKAIVEASNDTLSEGRTNTLDTITNGLKTARDKVGKMVQGIVSADVAKDPQGILPASTMLNQVDAVTQGLNAPSSMFPETNKIRSVIEDYGTKFPTLSWDHIKDIRTEVQSALQNATGKDRAALGKLNEAFTGIMSQRADQLGLKNGFAAYNSLNEAIRGMRKGIVKTLAGSNDGLDFFKKFTDSTQKPQVTALLDLLEQHGGVNKTDLLNTVKQYEPLQTLSEASSKGPLSVGSKFAAFKRHPLAAIPAALVAGSAPLGPGMKFIMGLMAASKASDLADQFDAARAVNELKKGNVAATSPSAPSPAGAPQNAPQAPSSAPPVQTAPTAAHTPVATQAAVVPNVTGPGAALVTKLQSAGASPQQIQQVLPSIQQASAKMQGAVASFNKATIPTPVAPAAPVAPPVAPTVPSVAKVAKSVKVTPPKIYEQFGVKIDPTTWKTPEDVVQGKADAMTQLHDGAKARAEALDAAVKAGTITQNEAMSSKDRLVKDILKSADTIKKQQAPAVGRDARDRLRKAATAIPTSDINMSDPNTESRTRASAGTTELNEDAISQVASLEKGFRALGQAKAYQQVAREWEKTGSTNHADLAEMLQEKFDELTKKK